MITGITTKNFQYRCNGLSTSEESITLVSPVEKTRYVYSLNKKVNTGYLKSTKTKELGVWSFLYIWWFCMHNEWQYIAINFLLPLYILNNLFLFMDYWITCKQGQTNYITDYCQAFLFILIYSMLEEIMLLSTRQCYTLLGYWQN